MYNYGSLRFHFFNVVGNLEPSSAFARTALHCHKNLLLSVSHFRTDPQTPIPSRQYYCPVIHGSAKTIVVQANSVVELLSFTFLDVSVILTGLNEGAVLFRDRLPDFDFTISVVPFPTVVVHGIWGHTTGEIDMN